MAVVNEDKLVELLYATYPGLKELIEEGGDPDQYIEYCKHASEAHRNIQSYKTYMDIINKVKNKGLTSILYKDYVTGVSKHYTDALGSHDENIKVPIIVVTTIYATFAIDFYGDIIYAW